MKLQNNHLTGSTATWIAHFLGGLQVICLALFAPNHIQAAPLDYEIGNSSARNCKLVYSDGRPDEQLSSCEGTKDFGNVTSPFTVKMVMTNEINQDVESEAVDIKALDKCSAINPGDIKVTSGTEGFDVTKLHGCTLFYDAYFGSPQDIRTVGYFSAPCPYFSDVTDSEGVRRYANRNSSCFGESSVTYPRIKQIRSVDVTTSWTQYSLWSFIRGAYTSNEYEGPSSSSPKSTDRVITRVDITQ